MTENKRIESSLPDLDRRDDPRGGAAAWALLAVGAALVSGIVLVVVMVFLLGQAQTGALAGSPLEPITVTI